MPNKSRAFDLLSLIYKKRKKESLSSEEISEWIKSLLSKSPPPDYQISSLLAFIYQIGMSPTEITALTQAMRYSGTQFKYKGFPKNALFIDKHSTGGVGDKITLPLSALVTACSDDFYFPTISGRGLGHTGGTVDKLESIPGFKTTQDLPTFYKVLKKNRICFLSQSPQIVPADRILYALRDVTGTVESIPLITASILSKKLSESLDYLILDLKYGNGAFLTEIAQTEALAESLARVTREAGLKASVFVTRMNTPLGLYSGNRLEVAETLSILKGERPHSAAELTFAFTKKFLSLKNQDSHEADHSIETALQSGEAFRRFQKVIEAQGGSLARFEKAMKTAKVKKKIWVAPQSGYLCFDVKALGLAIVELGGGRKTKQDKIDVDVGLYHPLEAGTWVEKGQEILEVFYRDTPSLNRAQKFLNLGFSIQVEPPLVSPLIKKVIEG